MSVCPRCGGDDVSSFGDTEERTHADLTDWHECARCRLEWAGPNNPVSPVQVLHDDTHQFGTIIARLSSTMRLVRWLDGSRSEEHVADISEVQDPPTIATPIVYEPPTESMYGEDR